MNLKNKKNKLEKNLLLYNNIKMCQEKDVRNKDEETNIKKGRIYTKSETDGKSRAKRFYDRHKDEISVYKSSYYQKNKEEIKRKNLERYHRNKNKNEK